MRALLVGLVVALAVACGTEPVAQVVETPSAAPVDADALIAVITAFGQRFDALEERLTRLEASGRRQTQQPAPVVVPRPSLDIGPDIDLDALKRCLREIEDLANPLRMDGLVSISPLSDCSRAIR